jgi:tetratricopeptide (TPR) repeat protein
MLAMSAGCNQSSKPNEERLNRFFFQYTIMVVVHVEGCFVAVHFRIHVAAGALAALLVGAGFAVAIGDEVDEARQTCENSKADPNDRIPACTRLLDSGRKDIDIGAIYNVRAHAWYLRGNFDNAIADYRAAINYSPKMSSALQGLGNSYFRKADFVLSIKAYSDALNIDKSSADLYNNRGLAQLNIGEFGSAVKDFGEAIKINPKFVPAYNNRGIAHSKYKQFELAIKDFTKAIEIDPRFADAYMGRAEVLIVERGELDRGIKDYEKAISLDSKNWGAYSARGEAKRLKGDLDGAMADHNEAIRVHPSPEVYVNRALTWKAKGDPDRAIGDYDEAILLNPNYAAAYAARGNIFRLKGDFERSLADLDKAIKLNPKSATFLYLRGEVLRESGALDRAISDYDEALRLVPGLAAVYATRGLAYESKGDLARARTDFGKALALPSVSDAEQTKPAQETAKSHLAALDAAEKGALEAKRKAAVEAKEQAALETSRWKDLVAEARTALEATAAPPQRVLPDPGRRIALVIGESAYASHPPLPNARRDAQAIAASLRDVGFQTVVEEYDLGRQKLETTLQNFAHQATTANWAVVYYAGHGMEMGGTNYLIPVDAKLASDRDVEFEAVSLDHLLAAAEGAKKLRLVLLDACRDNPFAGTMQRTASLRTRSIVTRGLASIEPDAGTMVVYAARAGEVAMDGAGDHSPFAQALVSNFKKPGIEIRKLVDLVRDDVMKSTNRHQLPFHYGSLPGDEDFYFRWK